MRRSEPVTCKGWIVKKPAEKWTAEAVELSPQVLVPTPAAHEVRVRVHAAGVNPIDWKRTTFPASRGGPRYFSSSHRSAPRYVYPYTVGVDGAGEVDCIGVQVTRFKPGDRVMFFSSLHDQWGGSFCEYALLDEDSLVQIPSSGTTPPITYEEAAAIPCATWTAYIALFDKLRIEKDRSIFIDGASGGVGSAAVQLAHYLGLHVIASCSPSNADYVRGLGADVVLDYHHPSKLVDSILSDTNGHGVDYYLAVANSPEIEEFADALRFGGAVCALSNVLVPSNDLLCRRQISVHYVFLPGLHRGPQTRPQLQYVGEQVMRLYSDGAFAVKVSVIPFHDARKALQQLVTGGLIQGKLVVRVVPMDS